MAIGAKTLIFWGAGATATVGLRTTLQQAAAITKLTRMPRSCAQRCEDALPQAGKYIAPLSDLLTVLGDETQDIHYISPVAREAMGRHWHDPSPDALNLRIHDLRSKYDWPALKEILTICPGYDVDELRVQDVFNVIDLHAQTYHGFPVTKRFLAAGRLVAARRVLQLILNTLFFVDWQTALTSKVGELNKHLAFARLLTEHHQQEGLRLAATLEHFDHRDFYLGDISFASLNYDPVALWSQFVANRDGNANPPFIGAPRVPLKIFHDFGIFMAVSTIDPKTGAREQKERVWYPLNEASAQRLNDREHLSRRVRINRFLFPHGCLCWRECPSCGKLSAYMGKNWEFFSRTLIPPPPLRGFMELSGGNLEQESDRERVAWDRGEVDARDCVHCGELTFAEHTQAVMQSNFKMSPPSFIEEVQRDLRVATQAAEHIVLMGYSLPMDDVVYRAFLAARRQRRYTDSGNGPVQCSVVVGTDHGDRWHRPDEIDELLRHIDNSAQCEGPFSTLKAARAIFGSENVRFYGGGIPQVFCEGDQPSSKRFAQLVNWSVSR